MPNHVNDANRSFSRVVHERMLANIEDMEVLLQVSFGKGIQWLSTPDQNVHTGDNLASASIKCFVVSLQNH